MPHHHLSTPNPVQPSPKAARPLYIHLPDQRRYIDYFRQLLPSQPDDLGTIVSSFEP